MTREISCEEVIERLFAYLDRELDSDVAREIERHIETCRGCFTRAEFERRLRERVAGGGEARAPERLRRRVRAMIERF